MSLSNIEKKSTGYNLLKIWVRFWHNYIFYKNYIVLGKENIPTDKPIIFTPNHQNALMDALALLFSLNKTLVFVARADMFKKPAIAKILYFLKILPIYRIRDGFDAVKKSKDIILKTIDIIKSGSAMVILPEGNHSGIRRLRPLKKGFARMAFETEEANNFNLDIHIVPVGIDYNNYQKYQSSLIVNFGKPIAVKDYIELYKNNSAKAINQIKDKLAEHLKPLIVNIESDENYELYNQLRVIFRLQMAKALNIDGNDVKNRIYIDQQLIHKLEKYEKQNPSSVTEYAKIVNRYVKLRNKLGLTNTIIESGGLSLIRILSKSILLLLTTPLYIYGLINNILPYYLPLFISQKIKDPQFRSSIKFVILLLTFPIFYILQCLTIFLVFGSWKYTLAYFISLPISGTLAWMVQKSAIANKIEWKYKLLSTRKNKYLTEIQLLHNKIIVQAKNIINLQ